MAVAELGVNLTANTSQFNKTMNQVATQMKKSGKDFVSFGSTLTKLTAPIVAFGANALFSANQLDEAFDKIRAGTGATGQALEGLQGSFKSVFAQSTQSMNDVAGVIADFNTGLGLTGQPLEELATKVLGLSEATGEELAPVVEGTTELFNAWRISTTEQSDVLNTFLKVSQATGISVAELEQQVAQFQPQLKNLGFSIEESAALFGQLNKSGIDASKVMGGLNNAFVNFSKAGISDVSGAIKETFLGMENGSITATEAFQIFGKKAGGIFIQLAKDGKLSIDEFTKAIAENGETVESVRAANAGFAEALKQLKNIWSLFAAEIGTPILNNLGQLINETIIPAIKNLTEWWKQLAPSTQDAIKGFAATLVIAGPVVLILGKISIGLSVLVKAFAAGRIAATLFAGSTGIGLIVIAAAAAVALLIKYSDEVGRLIELFAKYVLALNPLAAAFNNATAQIDKAKGSVKELTDIQNDAKKSAETLGSKGVEPLKERLKQYEDQLDRARKAAKRMSDAGLKDTQGYKDQLAKVEKLQVGIGTLTGAIDKQTVAHGKSTKGKKDDTNATGELTGEIDGLTDKLTKEEKELAKLADTLEDENNPALERFRTAIQELQRQNPTKTFQELTPEILELAGAAQQAGLSIGMIESELAKIKAGAGGFGAGLFGESGFGQEINNALDKIGINLDIGGQLGKDFGNRFGADALTAITDILNGGDFENTFEQLGIKAVGAFADTLVPGSGPIAEAFAAKFSKVLAKTFKSTEGTIQSALAVMSGGVSLVFENQIGKVLDSMFGQTNKFAQYRSQLEQFIEKTFKDLHIESDFLVDGNFILDNHMFDPIKDAAGEVTTAAQEEFEKLGDLAPELEEGFRGVATTLAVMFDIPAEDIEGIIGQFTKLLEINFQNAAGLNELQIALSGIGLTAEEAEKMLGEAFLKGDLTAKQYLEGLKGIRDVLEKGIPGAIGAVDTAFSNLVTGGLKDGAHALDSIGDIGAEAMEKVDANGNRLINTLEDLRADLIASGKSVEDVDKFMNALAANGINSVEDLANVTTEQAAGIVSSLQDAGFGFQDLKDDIKEVKEELDDIKSKEVDIDVNVNYHENDRPDPIESSSGNIFDGGSIVPFAKGGIVPNFRMFDIGTMAENGPEAIMPLQRAADGTLGVKLVGSSPAPASNSYSINIDARGAQLGAAEQIKRELDKYFDIHNKLPGRRF